MNIKRAAVTHIAAIGIGSSTKNIPDIIKTRLIKENEIPVFFAILMLIRSDGSGLLGLETLSIEKSEISLNVFPAAMKHITEVV